MSAGHHTSERHSVAMKRELAGLLADPMVKKLVEGPIKVDFSHKMPLTGGSSVKWGQFYLDPRLKERFTVGNKANQDLSKPVLRHEVVEKALRQVFGFSYDRAHAFATLAERLVVEAMGMSWAAYKAVMASIVRRDEKQQPKSFPAGFDFGPFRESRGLKSLRWINRAA